MAVNYRSGLLNRVALKLVIFRSCSGPLQIQLGKTSPNIQASSLIFSELTLGLQQWYLQHFIQTSSITLSPVQNTSSQTPYEIEPGTPGTHKSVFQKVLQMTVIHTQVYQLCLKQKGHPQAILAAIPFFQKRFCSTKPHFKFQRKTEVGLPPSSLLGERPHICFQLD